LSKIPHVDKPHEVYKAIEQIAVNFLAPIYFVSIGLQANFMVNFDWSLVLVVMALVTSMLSGPVIRGLLKKESFPA
jgi:Kef-type K+ transport system membrane component KefB